MDNYEKIKYYQELISCSYNVYLWTYDSNVTLLNTNCPNEMIASDMITLLNFSSVLLSQAQTEHHYPIILDTDLGLLWIAAFEYRQFQLHRIHVIGPSFTGRNSQMVIKKKLDSYNISVQLRSQIFHQIDHVPIIPSTTLMQFAVMLHFAICGEKISMDAISFSTNGDRSSDAGIRLISEEHRGIWKLEQNFLSLIREGSPNYKQALDKMMSLSSGMRIEFNDNMRQAKNNSFVLLTLCSRASMEGGLSPSVAYSLNDYYGKMIEECRSISETTTLNRTMLEDYVSRVRETKLDSSISGQILDIMNYISFHITEKISLTELAAQAGYTEYYLSYKFKKEVGVNMNDYIRRKKIEEAKLLLSCTEKSIFEISNDLSFGNRSYFYSCFQKEVGCSPSEYRVRNHMG
ncbi:MAG: helix-turn-helix domain-containing protein [Lachnospiraceae bacterium]